MATASPPSPPLRTPPPGDAGGGAGDGSSRAAGPGAGFSGRARALAFGALALVVLVLAYILLAGSSGADYKLEFENAGQLVRGDQVQVGGTAVGTVKDIVLTPRYTALVTIHVNPPLAPLHAGTTAQIRVPSLSGVANRYIALTPAPNSNPKLPAGAKLPASAAHSVTDIDQLFNIFNERTRKGLQQVFQGSAEQYAGAGPALQVSTPYFAPSLAATDHILAELTRDQKTFSDFLVQTAKAVTTIGARSQQLTGLVEHGDQAFGALAAHQVSLAQGVAELPGALRAGNHLFAQLPSTLSALRRLVDVSKPNVTTLAPFLAALRPLVVEATPVVHNLSVSVTQPGPNNDLTDALQGYPALERALIAATPAILRQLGEATGFFGRFRPYAPELVGAARSLGQSASYYDADGNYIRASAVFDAFTLGPENNLTPSASLQQGLANLKQGQLRRCPGAATQPAPDGSSPFTDTGQLECNPAQVP
ncbi:MAG TPA: MlaD family protein [Solirubrobacteraceae bacterium]|jgi:phospholipid/cholesterol/gamma-HCH transport system substrate-binding protein